MMVTDILKMKNPNKSPQLQTNTTKRIDELYSIFHGAAKVSSEKFNELPLAEKLSITKEILISSEKSGKVNQDLRKAAYYALFPEIIDYNLNLQNQKLDFIYDERHEKKVTDLINIIDFVRDKSKLQLEASNRQSFYKELKTSLKDIFLESASLCKNIGTEYKNFIKNKDLSYPLLKNIDSHVNNSLNKVRYYLKSDPTTRSATNRVKQLSGASFNLVTWFGKQCINIVRKPIALSFNILKTTIQTGILIKNYLTKNKEATESTKKILWQTVKETKKDLQDSIVAAIVLLSVAASEPLISLTTAALASAGIVGTGIATAVVLTAKANAIINSTPGLAVQLGKDGIQGIQVASKYNFTGPKLYSPAEKNALETLYKIVKNSHDIPLRQEALEKMNRLEEILEVEQLKKDRLGKAMHEIDSLSGKVAYKLNKYFGTYFDTSGLGVRYPAQKNKEGNKRTTR